MRDILKTSGTGMVVMGDPAWTDYTAETEVFVYDGWYSAWQAGPHRLNLKADADLTLPDVAAGTRKPTPLARAASRPIS